MGKFKVNTKDSSLFAGMVGATGPAPLSDQPTVPMGQHEASFRENKGARQAAMRATNSNPRIDSEPKQTTGAVPNFRAIREDEIRRA